MGNTDATSGIRPGISIGLVRANTPEFYTLPHYHPASASQAFIHPLVYSECCTSAYGALVLLSTLQKTLAYGVTVDLLKRGLPYIEEATRRGLVPCAPFLTAPVTNLVVPRVDILHPYSWNLDISAVRLYLDMGDNYRKSHGLPPIEHCHNCPWGDCHTQGILCHRKSI